MPGFGPLEHIEFRHTQTLRPEGVVQRVASVSHVAVLPDSEREAVLDEVREILRTHPDARNRADVDLVYRVDCLAVKRL